jgi:hypothetical protein
MDIMMFAKVPAVLCCRHRDVCGSTYNDYAADIMMVAAAPAIIMQQTL